MSKAILRTSRVVILLTLTLLLAQTSLSYSVLTHQAIIDTTWKDSLRPLLLKRFPQATDEQLREAHAYAYGGAIIQDMGYYPFGSKFYTDLAHYVRSGDFIEVMMAEAKDLNEYAFALGALAHYAADNNGHPIGVNRAVPLAYPKLRAQYGNEVTYVEDPAAHLKTEFSFDVIQVARGKYAPDSYHDFIGFKVSKDLLERAFLKTYDLELKDQFVSLDLAIGTFRRAVSGLIPEMTKVAWETKKDDIVKAQPGMTQEKFLYSIKRADYDKEFGKEYEKPGLGTKLLAGFVKFLPKVGPLKPLAFKPPTPEAERLFIESFNATLVRYRALLAQLRTGKLDLPNTDFDTGRPVRAGEYKLADETYAKLLKQLAKHNFENASPELRRDILAFYSDLSAPLATKRDKDEWRETLRALDQLKAMQSQPASARKQ
ncbi:MAG: hypothetical protein V7641_5316 [Blastocatellia bacterium]